MSEEFISGLNAGKRLYEEILKPTIDSNFPELVYSAALIGPGSEVLGFDTPLSTDHDWRPRAFIFVSQEDFQNRGKSIEDTLWSKQPESFMGHTLIPEKKDDLRSKYVYSVESFLLNYMGLEDTETLSIGDWLTLDEHKLLGFTNGEIYYGGLSRLTEKRDQLSYYPDDVWRYLMASQWQKISQEEAFVGRTGDVGDELGSKLITARIVQSLMRLCFYVERKYAPYSKWFGTGFSKLNCSSKLKPLFEQVESAIDWKTREAALVVVYEELLRMHNDLRITEPVNPKVQPYFDRPYTVVNAGRVSSVLQSSIRVNELKNMPLIGSINQFTDSVDFTENKEVSTKAKTLYS